MLAVAKVAMVALEETVQMEGQEPQVLMPLDTHLEQTEVQVEMEVMEATEQVVLMEVQVALFRSLLQRLTWIYYCS
jgi:hypothetical protein